MHNAPCKWAFGHDCPLRKAGCHAKCSEYAKFAEEREAWRQARGLHTASLPELPRKVVKQIWKEERWR